MGVVEAVKKWRAEAALAAEENARALDATRQKENGMPCASDVVHGKVVVTATTAAYFGEDAPTARSPFAETNGVPKAEGDVDFTTYAIAAERSL